MSEVQINLPPFQTPSEHWFAKLRSTPLKEVFRGTLSGSLDERRLIAEAQLPAPLDALAYAVVRRARLWPAERRDVAKELIAHFQDGLESGAAPEQLLQRFGDLGQAAQLIRRAKLRNRSWTWQIWRRLRQAAGISVLAAIVCYGLLAMRYSLGRPTIARDYAGELNDAHQAIPCEERAWPVYRTALLLMQPPPADAWWPTEDSSQPPTAQEWGLLTEYVRANAAAFPELHRASRYSRLGFVWGDPNDDQLFALRQMKNGLPPQGEPVIGLLLPQAQVLREAASLLAAAAALAQQEGDAAAYLADVTALLSLAEQIRTERGPLVEGLVSLAVYSLALHSMAECIADRPELLSAQDWIDLAHRTALYAGGGTFRLEIDFERQMFADFMQRCFTDDGHGDGRLTPAGLQLLSQLGSQEFSLTPSATWTDRLAGPGMSALVASRKEQTQLADAVFNSLQAGTNGPLWTWQPSQATSELQRLGSSMMDRLRYFPVLLLLPAYESMAAATEIKCQRRDAVLTAIALELYRREHGDWPEDLAVLAPHYLPQVLPDRFTGKPLAYRVKNGRPVLYSLGADLIDDGGQLPADPNHRPERDVGLIHRPCPPLFVGYDWILWPPSATRPVTESPAIAPPAE